TMRVLPLLLAVLVPAARAGAVYDFTSLLADPLSGVSISVKSIYDRLPHTGYMPVRIAIDNARGTGAGKWWFDFQSSAGLTRQTFTTSITVEPGRSRTHELLVPLATSSNANQYAGTQLSVTVHGNGVSGTSGIQYTPGTPMRDATAFLGLSEALGRWAAGPIGKLLEGQKRSLAYTTFDPTLLPADWRGGAGVGGGLRDPRGRAPRAPAPPRPLPG